MLLQRFHNIIILVIITYIVYCRDVVINNVSREEDEKYNNILLHHTYS